MEDPTSLTAEDLPSGIKLVTIHGELDSMGTHMIEESLTSALQGTASKAVLDLSHVDFISSAGMAMLLVRGKALQQRGAIVVLAGVDERVRESLRLIGFEDLFNFYENRDSAVAALGG